VKEKGKLITALEAFASQAKRGTDPNVTAFYSALILHGAAGELGQHLLLAQRSHDRLQRLYKREVIDPDYERLLQGRNNTQIKNLLEFCLKEHSRLNIVLKKFKYGIRITLRREAVIRFRHIGNYWTGDDANFQPILDYCDRVANE